MILVDANLVLYAEDALSPQHESARTWWDAQLSGASPVCLSWGVLCAFIRISTNARVYERPLNLDQAMSRVQSWLDQPCVRLVHPTERHWTVLQVLLRRDRRSGTSSRMHTSRRSPCSTAARSCRPMVTLRDFPSSSGAIH